MTVPETTPITPKSETNLKDLESKFESKVASLETQLNSLNQILANVLDKKFSGELESEMGATPPAPLKIEEDWEESFRLEPAKAVEHVIDPKLDQLEKKIDRAIDKKIKDTDEVKRFDSMAYAEFPQLRDANHPLRKETEKILGEKRRVDPKFDASPAAIYDAANIAYAKLVRTGIIMPDAFKEEAQRLASIADGTLLPVRGGGGRNSREDEVTPGQALWAKKLGVSVDAYKKRKKELIDRSALKDVE